MSRFTLRSSAIQSIDSDLETGHLLVEFNNGALYEYSNVPRHIVDALLNAPSKGKFFNEAIRGHFPYKLATAGSRQFLS